MSRALRLGPCRRRILALIVALMAVADVAIFAVAGYAHTSRTHARLSISSDEIVQVFVNCRLAYVYEKRGAATETPDLGWIAKSATLTFQVRSFQALGYYELAFSHDGHAVQVDARGTPSHNVLLPPTRVLFKRSFVAATGARLGDQGCQKDASPQLAFAESAGGNWDSGTQEPFVLANAFAPVVPWALAVFGAIFLVVAAVLDRARQGHGPIARIVAAVDMVSAASSLMAQDFALAAGLCIAAGIGSLLALFYWLLAEDLRRIVARWIARKSPRKPLDSAAASPSA
jgi:hypothetical protein